MLTLQHPPELKVRDGAARLTLLLCDPGDWEYSFRATLSEIEQTLAKSAPTSLTLPSEEPDEDCVEGQLMWGARRFMIYFEHGLGYLEFSSISLSEIEELRSAL